MPEENNEQPIYERQDGEPANWYARYLIYRGLEAATRSLHSAYVSYMAKAGKSPRKPSQSVEVPGAWKENADKWQWKRRAEAYDAKMQAEAEARAARLREIEAAEIEAIMTSGYALMHNRIAGLDAMARLIEKSWKDNDAEDGVNFKWFSPDKVREYRGCLDDIAKELGARAKKTELTGKDGGPIEFITEWGGGVVEESNEEDG